MIVRPATMEDAAGIAAVHVTTWRSAYAGIMPEAVLAELTVEARTARWRTNLATAAPGVFTLVAVDAAGAIVGFVGGGPNRGTEAGLDWELYALYVLPDQQGRGVGRALVRAFAAESRARGARAMLLWVLADNPAARRAYEALGGRLLDGAKDFEIGGVRLAEVAYGWDDLGAFKTPV